jgi:hypothetical protein
MGSENRTALIMQFQPFNRLPWQAAMGFWAM